MTGTPGLCPFSKYFVGSGANSMHTHVVWKSLRAMDIAMVKTNQKGKKPSESLTCIFCVNDLLENQEHSKNFDGTKFERKGVRVIESQTGREIFWSRMTQMMTQKITQKTANVTSIPEVHLPEAPCG